MPRLKILFTASEVVGYAKTGGLADVAGSLPRALAARGHQVAMVMPLYRSIRTAKIPPLRTEHVIPVPLGSRTLACRIHRSDPAELGVPIFFIDAPEYFDRDDPSMGKGLYQQNMPGGYKADYPDNAERFTFFSRAVLEACTAIGFTPEIIHANDWQTGLVPVYLSEAYRDRPEFANTRSVFTIHNIGYQGMFSADVLRLTRLPVTLFNPAQLEYHGHINFLKAGIVFADAVNTVSPTYSREIQTSEYGCGLEGLLRAYRYKLSGIVNGVDYTLWDPIHDPYLPVQYGIENVQQRKLVCKRELLGRFDLPDADRPVLGLVARLVNQKGIDLILGAAPGFLDLGCNLVLLGEGDPEYHAEFAKLRRMHPDRVGVNIGFDEGLAHLVEAGSDLFLMPSRYEPCGLNQLYSLKYGTPPVVHSTGGLADTVVNATEENIRDGTATGFSFDAHTAHALYETVKWAIRLFRDRTDDFYEIVRTAMRQDWSWARSAFEYETMYRKIMQ